MSLPDNCWTIRDGRKVIDRIPDDGNVESAVELLREGLAKYWGIGFEVGKRRSKGVLKQ